MMDNNNKINIAFSCNNAWVDKLAVVVTTILQHARPDELYNFYVLDGGISRLNRFRLHKMSYKKNFKFKFIKVNKEIFKDVILNTDDFTIEVYYRLLLSTLIKEDKILYLDADIFVRKNISDFYNLNIDNYYVAAVEDFGSRVRKVHKLNVKKYFNAGVTLFNLKKIREENLEEQFFDIMNNHKELISWQEQCILNYVFKENILLINDIYNFQKHSDKIIMTIDDYEKVKDNIVIIHFCSKNKPWNFKQNKRFIFEYYSYLFKTPFKFNIFKDIYKNFFEKNIHLSLLLGKIYFSS